MPQRPDNGGTAFVLGGGGSLGATQVGMLRGLLERGIRPDFIVGVSAGAINGAFYARQPTQAGLASLAAIWEGVSTRQALGLSWRSVLGVLGLRDHIANPAGLRALLERHLSKRSFADSVVPLHVLCAELHSGQGVLLSSGDLIGAILASAAIPGVFPAVECNGQLLVDGAVANVSPIEAAVRLGAKRIFVMPCTTGSPGVGPQRGALQRATHAIRLIAARQLRTDLELFANSAAIHVVPPPVTDCAAYDYSRGRELVTRAQLSTSLWLDHGRAVGPYVSSLAATTHSG